VQKGLRSPLRSPMKIEFEIPGPLLAEDAMVYYGFVCETYESILRGSLIKFSLRCQKAILLLTNPQSSEDEIQSELAYLAFLRQNFEAEVSIVLPLLKAVSKHIRTPELGLDMWIQDMNASCEESLKEINTLRAKNG